MGEKNVHPVLAIIPYLENPVNMNEVINVVINVLENGEREEDRICVRNENYYEHTIPNYSLDEFRLHFRMKREAMEVSFIYFSLRKY